ncbi:MAG: hypothetical protein ACRED5_07995 [Propylenella sp.]
MDFDRRLIGTHQVERLHGALAASFQSWRERQTIFEFRSRFDVEAEIASFYGDYLQGPFRDQRGGSRFDNALWLTLIAKALAPSLIVDSGTFTGGSAWALARGAPGARIFSFDIDLSHLRRRVANAEYVESDWTARNFSRVETSDALCYFDDHVDQARRLIEAHERGFRYAIFDDDYPITSFAHIARDASVLPKVEFVLDDDLRDGDVVEWSAEGAQHRWIVDAAYLARARRTIAATERLPDTSLITGIHQAPYRVVRFAR